MNNFTDRFLYIDNHTGSSLFISYYVHISGTSTIDLRQGVPSLRAINFCTTVRNFLCLYTVSKNSSSAAATTAIV